MKFDIFDEKTWDGESEVSREERNNNRAIGAIGNKICELQNLRKLIIKGMDPLESSAFRYADMLKTSDPEAFREFGITITHATEKTKHLIDNIDYILKFWKDKNNHPQWRMIIAMFYSLEPYLKNEVPTCGMSFDTFQLLVPTVSGNKAWNCYLAMCKQNKVLQANLKLAEDAIDSIDSNDDSNDDYLDE